MEFATPKTPENPPATPVYSTQFAPQDDEVDFIRLWLVLVKRKFVLFITTLVCISIGGLYILTSAPVYKSEARFLPPLKQNIQGLIIRGLDEEKDSVNADTYTPEVVYAEFTKNLKSRALRRELFDKNKLMDYYKSNASIRIFSQSEPNPDMVFEEKFNEKLNITTNKRDERFITISFELDTADLAAKWLNEFVNLANERTIAQLYTNVVTEINSQIQRLQVEIDSKLDLARQRREDRVVRLQEALNIATNLGITESGENAAFINASKPGIAVNTAQIPLYMRGTRALKAEIDVLKSRENDSPFVPDLRDLQEELMYLNNMRISRGELLAATIDQRAIVPDEPQSPKKLVVLALSLFLGMLLGVTLAFFAEFLSKARQRIKNQE